MRAAMQDGHRFAFVMILGGIGNDYKENGAYFRARFTFEDALKTALG